MQIVSLHRTNTALRKQVDEKRALLEKRTVKTDQSARVIAASADVGGAATAATNEAPTQLLQLRADVAALEKKAVEQYAANPEETDAPSTNRDPERGMTKLEYMQSVGQGTPAAAAADVFLGRVEGR